jgi:hypothetical protein
VRPYVAQDDSGRRSAVDQRTTRHRLRREPAHPQAHRGGVRLDQDRRGAAARLSSEAFGGWAEPSPSRPPPAGPKLIEAAT